MMMALEILPGDTRHYCIVSGLVGEECKGSRTIVEKEFDEEGSLDIPGAEVPVACMESQQRVQLMMLNRSTRTLSSTNGGS